MSDPDEVGPLSRPKAPNKPNDSRRVWLDGVTERSLAARTCGMKSGTGSAIPAAACWDGQQQQSCSAHAIVVQSDVLLMNEPYSALDRISTTAIEALIGELKEGCAIVIVTHNMQQAARVSVQAGFSNLPPVEKPGRVVELDDTEEILSNPRERAVEDYILGWFG